MNVLAIGAHPDDIELGAGGTLARHVDAGDKVTMLVITNGENGPGSTHLRKEEQSSSCKTLGVTNLMWGELPDLDVGNFERDCVRIIEDAIKANNIDRIYTHGLHDTHQDHRAVAHCTLGAARNMAEILFYQSPSSYSFQPTMFVRLDDNYLDLKLASLLCHGTQVAASEKVSPEHVRGECLAAGRLARTGAAEAFAPHRFQLVIA